MPEYRFVQEVVVPAPPERVWAVLSDVARWPSWTSSMREVTPQDPGPLHVGTRVVVRQPRMPTMTWTVDRVEPGRSFSWSVRSPGAHGVGDHRVEEVPGGSRVTLEIRQSGPLAGLVRLLFGRITTRYMRLEAEGLKRSVEQPPGRRSR